MKKTKWSIAILAVAALAIGCNKSRTSDESNPASDTNSDSTSVTQQVENAREAATNAWQKAKETTTNAWNKLEESLQSAMDDSYDKKADFVDLARTNLDSIDGKIKALSDKAATASDSVKAEAQTKIQSLRDQRTALNQKLDALSNATETNWNVAKSDFQQAYNQVKTSCKETWQWLAKQLNS
jgi:uncharacterized coiled-coil DUF342 family protein